MHPVLPDLEEEDQLSIEQTERGFNFANSAQFIIINNRPMSGGPGYRAANGVWRCSDRYIDWQAMQLQLQLLLQNPPGVVPPFRPHAYSVRDVIVFVTFGAFPARQSVSFDEQFQFRQRQTATTTNGENGRPAGHAAAVPCTYRLPLQPAAACVASEFSAT